MDNKELLEAIIADIENVYVEIPGSLGMSVKELQGWMNGYAVCHATILELLKRREESLRDPIYN